MTGKERNTKEEMEKKQQPVSLKDGAGKGKQPLEGWQQRTAFRGRRPKPGCNREPGTPAGGSPRAANKRHCGAPQSIVNNSRPANKTALNEPPGLAVFDSESTVSGASRGALSLPAAKLDRGNVFFGIGQARPTPDALGQGAGTVNVTGRDQ